MPYGTTCSACQNCECQCETVQKPNGTKSFASMQKARISHSLRLLPRKNAARLRQSAHDSEEVSPLVRLDRDVLGFVLREEIEGLQGLLEPAQLVAGLPDIERGRPVPDLPRLVEQVQRLLRQVLTPPALGEELQCLGRQCQCRHFDFVFPAFDIDLYG